MKPLLTPSHMYALEADHFAGGMSSLTAMEHAAAAFTDELIRFCGSLTGKRIIVACGSGNNGGDGYAAACLLHHQGANVSLLPMTPIDFLRGDAAFNARLSVSTPGISCISPESVDSCERPDVWVDALFGIGLNRTMPGQYQALISLMEADRAEGSIIAAIDVPSGLNAETGKIEGFAVHADLTVTFQHAKPGHYLLDGMDCTGKLVVCDIGLNRFPADANTYLVEPVDPACALPHRPHNCHKGAFGHLLVIAGSLGMAGAAMYAAHAALRCGAGLVSIACPYSVAPVLQTLLPAAMCIPLPEHAGVISGDAAPLVTAALVGKSAVVIGPGLTTKADPEILRIVLASGLPTVIDADALNLLALNPPLQILLGPNHIITPHPGEARRLHPDCCGNPLADARILRRMNPVVLLKGASSVICGDNIYISASGSPGMATGGSGDVLSGVIGALLASGIDPQTAAWAGSELHGRCGELAEKNINPVSMTASDLIAALPDAISEIYR